MNNNKPKIAAIIVAAGEGRRMGAFDKVFGKLEGEPILLRATRPFQECEVIDRIVVVVSGDNENKCRTLVTGEEWSKVTDVCLGGRRRQDSVAAGMERIEDCEWVVIHDGARPLITIDLIERGLAEARETGAAAAAVPVTDTVKVVDESGMVSQTPPRRNLRAVQTPQVFRYDLIKMAHRQDCGDVTDDATLVENMGHRVKLYEGSYDNIKITTPADLVLAEVLLKRYDE